MKKGIHPQYYSNCQVTCACGNSFTIGSTKKEIKVEICSACHPFYTGKQKLVDTARRVEKFQARTAQQAKISADRKGRKAKRENLRKKRAKDVEIIKPKSIKTKITKAKKDSAKKADQTKTPEKK